MSTKPVIGVILGDATGVGPEIVVKSLQDPSIFSLANWLVISDERVFQQGLEIAKADLSYYSTKKVSEISFEKSSLCVLDIENLSPSDYEHKKVSKVAGKAVDEAFQVALKLVDEKRINGVLYGPLSKEALQRAGVHFEDEIQYFSEAIEFKNKINLVSSLGPLWAIRVTNHIPVSKIAQNITLSSVYDTIAAGYDVLKRAGYENPKIYIAGLNPHCGEGGMEGNEEIVAIEPAIKKAQSEGIDIEGPFPADTIFLRTQQQPVDMVICMYHDQAQIGLKMLGFKIGVTIVDGLPAPFMTPAHGTAYGRAGEGRADATATKEAFKMVVKMASMYD